MTNYTTHYMTNYTTHYMTHYMTHYRTHYTTHYTTNYTTHYKTHYIIHYTTHYMSMMHDGGRHPSVEDNLWWKRTFGGRRPSMEEDLRWKMTFGGRRPSVEFNLCWILACCLLRFATFLAPMSSSRSDDGTKSVCLSACLCVVILLSLEILKYLNLDV